MRKPAFAVSIAAMNILDIAIKAEGSPSALAAALGVTRQNINNWRNRGMPHMVTRAIKAQYAKQISKAINAEQAEKTA